MNDLAKRRTGRAINALARSMSELPAPTPDLALLPNHVQTAVRRSELLAALKLPANARLQFGGREWLQGYDDEACLIVTVPT